jgi:biotin operon repressor
LIEVESVGGTCRSTGSGSGWLAGWRAWTTAVLEQIAGHPGTVSTVLAEAMGSARQDFKGHVRRLKELGLTVSLDTGYRLSPRGVAYLRHVRNGATPDAAVALAQRAKV